jgi:hypothetical protein
MDLRSGIRDPEKTYSGSRIQGSKRHRIPDPDPQHFPTEKPLMLQHLFDADPEPTFHLDAQPDPDSGKSTV